jgi:hypothetical protein
MKQGAVRQADAGFVVDEALAWLGVGVASVRAQSSSNSHRGEIEPLRERKIGRGKEGRGLMRACPAAAALPAHRAQGGGGI